jgi:hypothetical protein
MTHLPTALDFEHGALVPACTFPPRSTRGLSIAANDAPKAAVPVPAKSERPAEGKVWTAQEIALATFWVAG